jgi:hypothetical protein
VKRGSTMFPLNRFDLGPALILACGMVVWCACCPRAQARIIRVSPSGNGTDGNSWVTAYTSISTAVSSASDDDSIWVKGGSYGGGIFIQKNINLLGGFAGIESDVEENLRNPAKNKTTIDGGGLPHGLMGCISDCAIDGFIMRNAGSTGVLIYNGAKAVITRCQITGNYPTEGVTFGGGVAVSDAAPTFIDCEIINNSGTLSGSGVHIEEYSTVNISYCTISNNNSVYGSGGGISCTYSTITMENCVVTNNSAYPNSPEVKSSFGGGISIGGDGSIGIFKNCLIANNGSTKWKQLAIGSSSDPYVSFDNCTIIGDLAADAHWRNAPPTMTKCIFWGANSILAGEDGQADLSYSCIQGGYPGLGNISDDPKFRDPANGDYSLLPDSPCIDTAGTSGPSDDLNGKPRPVDIAGIGCEVTSTYDMGAYEFQVEDLPHPSAVSEWMLYGVGD